MNRTVFYSWQSDTDQKINRNLVEDALKRAVRNIKNDPGTMVEPAIDRDTAGLPGSPDISGVILSKIAHADVFVADVTIINPRARRRQTPNPNVTLELGYAISILGWDRILLVQNTAFGSPEKLPFDLRGRRVVAYSLRIEDSNRSEVRGLLQGRLEAALKDAMTESAGVGGQLRDAVPLWWGRWRVQSSVDVRGGQLTIREVGPTGFLFDITVFNGSHGGQASGFAHVVGKDLAYATLPGSSADDGGELRFRRSAVRDGRRELQVEETRSCLHWHGMGVTFDNTFVHREERLFDVGALDELDLQRLQSITGQYYDRLTDSFQSVGLADNHDAFSANVTVGGVRGMYTFIEAIVMRGSRGQLWTAFIDDDVVRYFTTEAAYRCRLPQTIEEWREGFKEKPVVVDSEVVRIPTDDL